MKKILLFFVLVLCINIVNAYEYNVSGTDFSTTGYNQFRFETVKYEPYPVTPGDYFEVWIKITNYGGGEMENVIIELQQEYPFSSYDNDYKKELGKLNTNQQFVVKFKVKVDDNAVEGVENLKIKAYENEWSYPVTPYFPIQIQTRIASIDIASVTTEPERIIPGSPALLNINLKNTASTIMRDINVKLDLTGLPFTPLNSINEKKIRKLSPNEEVSINFDIIADPDAESKPYKIPLQFTFYDGLDNLQTKNYTIGLLVDSKADLQLDLEETDIYTKGKSGKTIISISNIGPTDLKFVSLQLMESDDYEIIGTDRVYLGNLESDDFETAEFKLNSKSSEDIKLKVLIDYKNAYNEEKNKIYEINLPMYSKNNAIAYGLLTPDKGIFSVIIYIILILFIYSLYKEWKIQKDLGKSVNIVIKRWIKKIFNFIKPKNLINIPKRIKKFLKE
ncbi:MAG: COG1361 S-layer family protein [Nanoarchaeota archaeon]|nr:COG1361 S-layer family protein [Nanoarchaeota archaeon]